MRGLALILGGKLVGLLALAVLLSAAAGAWYLLQPEHSNQRASGNGLITEGSPAPEFELLSGDGTTLSSQAYHGQPVLLFFNMGSG